VTSLSSSFSSSPSRDSWPSSASVLPLNEVDSPVPGWRDQLRLADCSPLFVFFPKEPGEPSAFLISHPSAACKPFCIRRRTVFSALRPGLQNLTVFLCAPALPQFCPPVGSRFAIGPGSPDLPKTPGRPLEFPHPYFSITPAQFFATKANKCTGVDALSSLTLPIGWGLFFGCLVIESISSSCRRSSFFACWAPFDWPHQFDGLQERCQSFLSPETLGAQNSELVPALVELPPLTRASFGGPGLPFSFYGAGEFPRFSPCRAAFFSEGFPTVVVIDLSRCRRTTTR